jgi:putative nucleotidyltransferase with HDIG domain
MNKSLKKKLDDIYVKYKGGIGERNINLNIVIKGFIIFSFIMISMILFPRGMSYQYADFKVGMVTDKEIIAPFDFPILKTEDELETEKEEVIKSVYLYFSLNQRIYEKQLLEFDNFFRQIYEVVNLKKKLSSLSIKMRTIKSDSLQKLLIAPVQSAIDSLKMDFRNYYYIDIEKKSWDELLKSDKKVIDVLYKNIRRILNELISIGIINQPRQNFRQDAQINYNYKGVSEIRKLSDFIDEGEAKEVASKRLRSLYSNQNGIVDVGYEILNFFIYPNIMYDGETTGKKIEEAISKIALAKGMVLKDQRIVDSHEIVTKEIYDKIRSLRIKMFEEGTVKGLYGVVHYTGRALFVSLLLFILFIYVYIYRRKIFYDNKKILLITIIILIEFLFAYLISERLKLSPYLIPTTIASLLLAVLFDSAIAYVGTIVVSLGMGGYFGSEFILIIVSTIAGIAGIYSVYKVRQRSQFFRSIFFIMMAYFISLVSMGLFSFLPSELILKNFVYSLPNSFFSPIITLGMLYIFEWSFGITTNIRLLELSDMNHPLLRSLAMKAPGTYQHSIIMGNYAEAAADSIGANSLLARVGAYYHDVGKMLKPEYFAENQAGPNPHDKLSPSMSCLIISSHVKEGVEIAKKYKLPNEICDFIRQHHGTSKISFFYELAIQKTDPKYLNELDFRYGGPKPQTKETGILMLADGVEAAVKSLKNPSFTKFKEVVSSVMENKFKDGQLDECELTFKDLSLISNSFVKTLLGIFRTRIEYPSQSKEIQEKSKSQEKIAQIKNSNSK